VKSKEMSCIWKIIKCIGIIPLGILKFLDIIWRFIGGVLLAIFIYSLLVNIFESKPFRFESFATKEEAQQYIHKNYPVGSDVNLLFDDLKKVGVKKISREKKGQPWEMGKGKEHIQYDKEYSCHYFNQWVSFNPWAYYVLFIHVKNNDEIAYIILNRWLKFS
jgi:hypothetical protein